jgi:ubiquinone/menaquinone biosynthesis C-methylase UbiE
VPYGQEYVGVDTDERLIGQARERKDDRLVFVQAGPDALPFPEARFDLIVSSMRAHTWASPEANLRQLVRVLSDSGKLVIVDAIPPKKVIELINDAGLHVDHETVERSAFGVPRVWAYVGGFD